MILSLPQRRAFSRCSDVPALVIGCDMWRVEGSPQTRVRACALDSWAQVSNEASLLHMLQSFGGLSGVPLDHSSSNTLHNTLYALTAPGGERAVVTRSHAVATTALVRWCAWVM